MSESKIKKVSESFRRRMEGPEATPTPSYKKPPTDEEIREQEEKELPLSEVIKRRLQKYYKRSED